jgi:hypothetical protein
MRALLVLAPLVVALAAPSEARLVGASFPTLVKQSELIVTVRVKAEQHDAKTNAGYSDLEIVSVIAGTRPDGPLRIETDGEVHDVPITGVGEEWLLFLAKKDGKWTAARYGASYFKLVDAADPAVGKVSPLRSRSYTIKFAGRYAKMLKPARFAAGVKVEGKDPAATDIDVMLPVSEVAREVARLRARR